MVDAVREEYWYEADLEFVGISITPKFIDEALRDFWTSFAKRAVGSQEVCVQVVRDLSGAWEGVQVGDFDKYSGIKYVHFASNNALIGKPTLNIDISLRDKLNGKHLMVLEGVAISNDRIG